MISTCRYALVLIASYNVCDLIGRCIPLIERIKLTSRKGISIAVLSRFSFLPAFYYAAKYGGEGRMIALASALGFSNGYLTVCVLTEAPKGYKVSVAKSFQGVLLSVSSFISFFFAEFATSNICRYLCRGRNKILWATCLCFASWQAYFLGPFLTGCGS